MLAKHLRTNRAVLLALACAALAALVALGLLGCNMEEDDEPVVVEYRFGRIEEHSMYDRSAILKDSYYYSDQWFFSNPKERNDELALVSMQLVAAAAGNDADGRGEAALRDMGFDEVGFVPFGDDPKGDAAFVWGKKIIKNGSRTYTLVAVVIQAYATKAAQSMDSWLGNVTANEGDVTSGEHVGWAHAAETIIDEVVELGGSGPVKYWICGQSRGGAVTNIMSAHLLDRLGTRNSGIYAYAFEPPMTVDSGFDNERYGYIHNYVCSDDVVCMLPPWGMTRYGVVHEIKADTDAGLEEELEKLGSGAVDAKAGEDEKLTRAFVERLASIVPERADYSAEQTVEFADESGNPTTITYCYQRALQNFVSFAYGGEIGDINALTLIKNLVPLYSYVTAINKATDLDKAGRSEEARPYYWTAAQDMHSVLLSVSTSGSLSLDTTDIYAILTLIGPSTVDAGEDDDSGIIDQMYNYLAPLTNFVSSAEPMIYSHYYDTLIARLKLIAPQPELEDINIEITDPAAGDGVGKAPKGVETYIEGLGQSWLTAEAEWQDVEGKLPDNCVQHLSVTVRAVGHSVSEDMQLTLNNKSPESPLEVSYEDGASVIRAVYQVIIGNPQSNRAAFTGSSPQLVADGRELAAARYRKLAA